MAPCPGFSWACIAIAPAQHAVPPRILRKVWWHIRPMKEEAREFLAKLSAEEGQIIAKMQLDEMGVGLITAIKEFDHYYHNLVRHERLEEADHHFHLMQLGLPRLIAGVLETIPRFRYPAITFKSDELLIRGALGMVSSLGFIEQGRRFARAALAGECEIRRSAEHRYDVVMPNLVFNMEQHEADVEHHYLRFRKRKVDEAFNATLRRARDARPHRRAPERERLCLQGALHWLRCASSPG